MIDNVLERSRKREQNIRTLLQAVADQSVEKWATYAREVRLTSRAWAFEPPLDLREVNLAGCRLTGFDLSQADMFGANLSGACLLSANFWRSKLSCANLRQADLCRADVRAADLGLAFLESADLTDADLRNSSLRLATVVRCTLSRTLMMDTDIRLANFQGSDLSGAYLRGAYCTESEARGYRLAADQWLVTEPLSAADLLRNGRLLMEARKRIGSGDAKHNMAFVSYVREDRETVDRLVDDLRKFGVGVWRDVDALNPGHDWRAEVASRVESGAFFVACFSRHYWQREATQMNEELNLAIEQIRLRRDQVNWFIPIKLDESTVPNLIIRPGRDLTTFQWLDLSRDWDEGVLRLANTLWKRD
jgi:hypothetical protein